MEILNEEQSKDLHPLRPGHHTLVYSKLLQLKVGQTLIIKPSDWVTKSLPYPTIRRVAKNTGFKFDYGRTPDGKNWMAKRVG
jgi:hypothetical protein